MSVLDIKENGSFRILLNSKGKLFLKKLNSKETSTKLCKIVSKTILKGGKLQLGFHDGRTIIVDNKDAKVNDTVVFKLPEFKVDSYLKLEKNANVYLTGGSNVGNIGTVENVSDSVTVKIDNHVLVTGKENVFVLGKGSPVIEVK